LGAWVARVMLTAPGMQEAPERELSGAEPFFKMGLFLATTGEKPSVAVACLARIEAMRVL
jgi:hypothetical protein